MTLRPFQLLLLSRPVPGNFVLQTADCIFALALENFRRVTPRSIIGVAAFLQGLPKTASMHTPRRGCISAGTRNSEQYCRKNPLCKTLSHSASSGAIS